MFELAAKTWAVFCRTISRDSLREISVLLASGFVVLVTQLVLVPQLRAESQARPNIIFIMADDLGYGDLGCFGSNDCLCESKMLTMS